jgi:hypothetical protein
MLWPALDPFPMESVAVTEAVYAPPGVLTRNDGVCVFAPANAGGFTGKNVQAYVNAVFPGEKQDDEATAVSFTVSSRKN